MKRFYCQVCKRIKRTQSLPRAIDTPFAENPADRIGTCNYHITGRAVIQRKSFIKFAKPQIVKNVKKGRR